MMCSKTDFFELPLGDNYRECIEIEHSDEYRKGHDAGYNDGVESFRPKFEEMKARFDQEIAKLSRENEILKNPQCEQCDNFEFGMCQHYRSRDCYLYHRGGTLSLFKIKESK